MNNNKATYPGHASMLVANMLWGLMAPISKDSLIYFHEHGISPFALAMMRMIGAAVSFWVLSLFVETQKTTWADRGKMFVAGMLSIVFNQCLFIVGVSYTTPLDASVVTTMLPILTMILAAIVLREPITGLKAVGVVTGMSGAIMLILGLGDGVQREVAAEGENSVVGNSMCFIAQICFACYLVFFKNFISRFNAVTLMRWMFGSAAVVILPFAIPVLKDIDYAAIPMRTYLEIGYTVFVATFFTYLLVPVGQRLLRPTVVSIYNYVQPVMSATVSYMWGMTTFGVAKGIAIALVFSGVYIVTQSKSRQQMELEKKRQ